MTGKDLYNIETRSTVRALVTFKSSDYFVNLYSARGSYLYFYNLQGMVHSIRLGRSVLTYDVFYSRYFGGILLLDLNVVLRYGWKSQLNNPSCLSSATAAAKYSFGNKWCGNKCATSAGASFSSKGWCEFNNDVTFLVYRTSNPPTTLSTNKVGEQLTVTVKATPQTNNPNGGTTNGGTTSTTTSNSDTLSDGVRDFFLRALITTIIISLVIFGVIGLIIYCCVKLTPGAKSYEGFSYQYPTTGAQQVPQQMVMGTPSPAPAGQARIPMVNNNLGMPQAYNPQFGGQTQMSNGVPLPGQQGQMSVQMPLNQMGTPSNPQTGAFEAKKPVGI